MMTKKRKFKTLALALGIPLLFSFWYFTPVLDFPLGKESKKALPELSSFPAVVPTVKYGFALDTMHVTEGVIGRGQILGGLLSGHGVDYAAIDQIAKQAEDTFSVKKIRSGKPYLLLSADSLSSPQYFVYEPSIYEYVVYELTPPYQVKVVKRPMTTETRTSVGEIQSSLWNAMVDNGMSFELAAKMEDALQWSIDFHHLQQGDRFKLVYEQNYIEGEPAGVGRVLGAYYKNELNEYHALYFEKGKHTGYYDLEGRPMKAPFLRAPVKYSRISSRFNPRRFHPVLKRVRPHLGTDYAAPYGTPIYAVGNGVVTKAGYTKGNGNFVKIKHDKTYQTQYLHMQSFASGIRSGVQVKQGQVIGYVGATGLATGPHVCFRFWKNGHQVNHLRLSFPPPDPLPSELLPEYYVLRDKYMNEMDRVSFEALSAIAPQLSESSSEETPDSERNP